MAAAAPRTQRSPSAMAASSVVKRSRSCVPRWPSTQPASTAPPVRKKAEVCAAKASRNRRWRSVRRLRKDTVPVPGAQQVFPESATSAEEGTEGLEVCPDLLGGHETPHVRIPGLAHQLAEQPIAFRRRRCGEGTAELASCAVFVPEKVWTALGVREVGRQVCHGADYRFGPPRWQGRGNSTPA